MSDIFELKDLIYLLLGAILPGIGKVIISFFDDQITKKRSDKENEKYKLPESPENILSLCNGGVFLNKSDIKFKEPTESFHFSMPEGIYSQILSVNPYFDHADWPKDEKQKYWGEEDDSVLVDAIKKITTGISSEDIANIIELKKNEIAELFLNRSSEAFFNGKMYGIKPINDRRVGNEEIAHVEIGCYTTDYYTHRVMAAVHQKLLEDGSLRPFEGWKNINDFYPFLTSMGMDVLLIIENRSKVVITKRSKELINMDKDRWHVSMNEAISITDISLGKIDLEGCIIRGLREELGLDCNDYDNRAERYSHVFLVKKPFEVGFLVFVVIDELTENMVRDAYCTAQDAPLESTGNDKTGLYFLKVKRKEIKEFCENEDVTDTAIFALKMLGAKYEKL